MRSFLFSFVFLLSASEAALCQLQTIQTTDLISNAPAILNYNFSYLNTNKPQIFSGSGQPGSVAGSLLGSIYLDLTNNNVWQCFSPQCSVASPAWIKVNGGGSGGSYTFNPPLVNTSGVVTLATPLAVVYGGSGTATPSILAGTNIGVTGSWPNQTISFNGTETGTGNFVLSSSPVLVTPNLGQPSFLDCTNCMNLNLANTTGILAVGRGGTGTASPSLIAGANVTISGAWPNQTIASSGGGSLPGTTLGDTFYYTGTAVARLAGPTVPGTWVFSESPVSSGTPVAPAYVAAQTIPLCSAFPAGTSGYCLNSSGSTGFAQFVDSTTCNAAGCTIPASDVFGLVLLNNSSSQTAVLPQAATGANYPNESWIDIRNNGAGIWTISSTTSTFCQASCTSTYSLQQGHFVHFAVAAGNYYVGAAY